MSPYSYSLKPNQLFKITFLLSCLVFSACSDNSSTHIKSWDIHSNDTHDNTSNDVGDSTSSQDIPPANDTSDIDGTVDRDVKHELDSSEATRDISDLSDGDTLSEDTNQSGYFLCDPECKSEFGTIAKSNPNCPEPFPEEGTFCSTGTFGNNEYCYYCYSGMNTKSKEGFVDIYQCPGPAKQIWIYYDTTPYGAEGYYPNCGIGH